MKCTCKDRGCVSSIHMCICDYIVNKNDVSDLTRVCLSDHHDCVCIINTIQIDYAYQMQQRYRACKSLTHECLCAMDHSNCVAAQHECICLYKQASKCRHGHKRNFWCCMTLPSSLKK